MEPRVASKVQALVSVLIVYHLAAIVLLQVPGQPLRPLFAPYLSTFDLSQGWQLFAPDPPARNARLDARIRFSDGVVRTCALPSTWDPDLGQSMRFEHWQFLLAKDDAYRRMRPDAARWLARVAGQGDAVPRQITLVAHRVDVAPPGQVFLPLSHFQVFPQQVVVYEALLQP